ncbi:tetratricopeptide repeat protein [Geminocystis sp. NIES-3709]|uniref:tetratricopeptide repeat protein n=1 Tax=Geminocystis sp. NIES-3709 TaxID=1617448 RepID=UPI0005FC3C27|nr:tetratricopeptide repeat protein [Geminocystis sp. NIES-3709]BAQ66810.1 Zn-dependent protease with chaperone function [Geminocystis sp. NIES-3709]
MTNSFSQTQFEQNYRKGKLAFDTGRYRVSIDHLEQASQLISPYSSLAGEVKIWLVNAYEAAGETEKAIALCQELSSHSDKETKKQALQLLYIIKAPKLQRPKEWMTEIPDLLNNTSPSNQYRQASSPNRKIKPKRQIELIDLSKVNTKDNQFIWLSLGVTSITIVGLFIF